MAAQEFRHGLGMLLGKGTAHHGHTRQQARSRVARQLIPHIGQTYRRRQLAFALCDGSGLERLGQHAHGGRVGKQGRQHLGGLALKLERHLAGQARALQQVVHDVLRRGALARHVDGTTCKIAKRGNVRVARHHAQHAQRVDVDDLHRALGLVVEHARHVGGHQGNVDIALNDLGHDLVGRGADRKVEIVVRGTVGRLVHKLHQTNRRRTLERGDVHLDRLGSGTVSGLPGSRARSRPGPGRPAATTNQCKRQRARGKRRGKPPARHLNIKRTHR